MHLAEIRHWKWTHNNEALIRAPSHPLGGGMPTLHILWEWKKNPRGYQVNEGLLQHPSIKYDTNMEGGGDRRPESDGEEERPRGGDAGARPSQAAKSEQHAGRDVKLEPRIKEERDG